MDFKKPPARSYGTLDQKAGLGEMIKPAETIDIVGVEGLTLQDKRIWNALIANAHGPEMRQQDRDYKIDLTPLRSNHNGNERVEDSIERLMKTIAVCHMPNGSVTRFQLLGGNNMGDPMRPRGELTYTFDKRLIAVLSESVSFGKLEISVMAAFNSKYALALYEHISRRINLKHHFMKEYTIDDFRDVLGVGKTQLKAFGNLKQRAIMPALEEVNYWAPFRVHLTMKKTGQRVTSINMSWHLKDKEGRAKARAELDKSRDGRKARMKGIEESIVILSTDKLVDEQGDDLLSKDNSIN
ncbi:replication initiation protein [Tateyamaria sp.]|uniref:replication initiation protein n=1 Tax=Tateyamaria sp. TaxID=1929288 RepID=UPI003B21BFA2